MDNVTNIDQRCLGENLSFGDTIYLDADTPCGLFEACNGNKYIITEDFSTKIAIALVHRHLPPFTWQGLHQQPLEYGYWYGPYRIRLIHALRGKLTNRRPGTIAVGDRHASVECGYVGQKSALISLGYVGAKGFDFRDFDGWLVEPTAVGEPFFQQMPRGNTSVVLRPRLTRNQQKDKQEIAETSNALKQLMSSNTVEVSKKSSGASDS